MNKSKQVMQNNATFNGISGLNDEEVMLSRKKNGSARIEDHKAPAFAVEILQVLKEPMVVLLLISGTIYFLSGKPADGFFLIFAVMLIAGISLYQNHRSQKALQQLSSFTITPATVIRNGRSVKIPAAEIVIGDYLIAEEGCTVAADGMILQSNDFSVDESSMTGESLPVYRDKGDGRPLLMGTRVSTGLAIIEVNAIGNNTQLGKIGKDIHSIRQEKSPLEIQLNRFVRRMVYVGIVVWLIVLAFHLYRSGNFLQSLLQSLSLAMSILPEEIPVAFASFMALGAWALMQKGIVVKQMKTVETLGSASVICTDKTGTLTENKMEIVSLYSCTSSKFISQEQFNDPEAKDIIRMGMWASEPIPFDPMDIALHQAYSDHTGTDERTFYHMVHEYPLEGTPPMMTHVFENEQKDRIIASKGAPEAYLKRSAANSASLERAKNALASLAGKGYRVLGVASAVNQELEFAIRQQDIPMQLIGLVAFYDPPKKNMTAVLQGFYRAGIKVKVLTGDNAITASAIAAEIGLQGAEHYLDGSVLLTLQEGELIQKSAEVTLFTRMFPQAKLSLVNALKRSGETVAMVGDGVNDGPALKAAHIGIAMGKKGTEVAKEAAALVLLRDDLSSMLEAIAIGRRIYDNLKKAIRYIISIHIPIILTVALPLLLGWKYPNIFSPVHVIFFELIMGPTCSIIYEREPIEKNAMSRPPRLFSRSLFSAREILISILQGLVISFGLLLLYQDCILKGYTYELTRTMVFSTLVMANMILTLVNRSFYDSIIRTLTYQNRLVPWVLAITTTLLLIILYFLPVTSFFQLDSPDIWQLLRCLAVAGLSTLWIELFLKQEFFPINRL